MPFGPAAAAAKSTPPRHRRIAAFTAVWLFALSLSLPAATLYVWQASPGPAAPYTNWATAAHAIQDAVDAAQAGDTVLVTNGVYANGGRVVYGIMTNRVALNKSLTVLSINGPAVTVIAGAPAPGGSTGDGAIRCAYVGHAAILSGFTLTNGFTRWTNGTPIQELSGGGVWCEDTFGVVTNCTVSGNWASFAGGGTYSGTLNNCILTGNRANYGGGANSATLNNCMLSGNSAASGGGADNGTLNNCTLDGNSAVGQGGGVDNGTLYHCTLSGNSADEGGGAFYCTLNNCVLAGNSAVEGGGTSSSKLHNCTLTGNSATYGGGSYYDALDNCTLARNSGTTSGGGMYYGSLYNGIVFYNNAPSGSNYLGSFFVYSCTTLVPPGAGNITNEPAFIDRAAGNLRLQTNSPCINAGDNLSARGTTDLDGRPRIVGGVVDMGAYEFQGAGMGEFIGWLQQFGQPTDGTADGTDPDQDGLNNWQEWVANTNPTNALSSFRVQAITAGPPVVMQFNSSLDRLYALKSCTNLSAPAWLDVPGQTGVPGSGGMLSLQDTNVVPARFYRVGVSLP